MHLDVTPLLPVIGRLRAAGLECALGGSGLLYSLGLAERVRDLDLTTDAALEQVEAALGALPRSLAPHGDGPFASSFRLSLQAGGAEVDLMGRFAIRTGGGVCHIPTVVCSTWQGVPVGSPEAWAVAYRLMQRHPKADLLSRYLAAGGARRSVVEYLLAQPLPPAVRAEVEAWPQT